MKVRELQQRLSQLDPELDVLCYTEEEDLLPKNHGFRLLEIDGVEISEGERRRADDQVPSLKLGKGPYSEKLAFINVTGDF
jgi:hypothetical protein